MPQALTLPAELTIYTVGELRPAWLTWMGQALSDTDDDLALQADASCVDQVDAAGVQLLLSLSNALGAHGRAFRLVHASQPLADACRMLGLSALLDTPAPEAIA